VLAKANRQCDPVALLEGDLKESQTDKFVAKGYDIDSDMRKSNRWELIREPTHGQSRAAPSRASARLRMSSGMTPAPSHAGFASTRSDGSSISGTMSMVAQTIASTLSRTARLARDPNSSGGLAGEVIGRASTSGEEREEDEDSSDSSVDMGEEVQDPVELLKQMDHLRIQGMVHKMYSPNVYYKGLTTTDFHTAILQLLDLPKEDVRLWLDLFERVWREERVLASRELERQAGLLPAMEVQATDGPEDSDQEEIACTQPAAVMRWMVLMIRMSGGGSGAGRAELLKVRDIEKLRAKRFERTRKDLLTMIELHREWTEAEEEKRREAEERLEALSRGGTKKTSEAEMVAVASSLRHRIEHEAEANAQEQQAGSVPRLSPRGDA